MTGNFFHNLALVETCALHMHLFYIVGVVIMYMVIIIIIIHA